MTTDLLVIGAGPAGMAAASTAARRGLATMLLDEQPRAGGQVYRAAPSGLRIAGSLGPDHDAGERLRAELAASGATHLPEHRVWNLRSGFDVDALTPDGVRSFSAPALIVATGTSERHLPFPGWTLPGIVGLAAATIMLKSQRLLPGRNVVVAGVGPLLLAVAHALLKAGAGVAAIVDAAPRGEWLGKLPRLAARADLLARGIAWQARILRHGVPHLHGHAVIAAHGAAGVERVRVARLDAAGSPTSETREITCDALAVGFGLVPGNDLTRLLGAAHAYAAPRGGWIATRDQDMRSSVERLYVAGDGGGVSGAVAAEIQGRIAALAAARDLGRIEAGAHAAAVAELRLRAAKAERFGGAMAELMAVRPALHRAVPRDCTVCRCEDVTRAEIEDAIEAGARDVNQLKAWTRAGMGPCQGKVCGEAVAELVAAHVGGRAAAGSFTARPPFRPLPTAALIGDFDYGDIPIPRPAPL